MASTAGCRWGRRCVTHARVTHASQQHASHTHARVQAGESAGDAAAVGQLRATLALNPAGVTLHFEVHPLPPPPPPPPRATSRRTAVTAQPTHRPTSKPPTCPPTSKPPTQPPTNFETAHPPTSFEQQRPPRRATQDQRGTQAEAGLAELAALLDSGAVTLPSAVRVAAIRASSLYLIPSVITKGGARIR
jgi:hypothetical protein